jgi:hypothetical protein
MAPRPALALRGRCAGGRGRPGRQYPLWSYQVAIDLDHFAALVDQVQHQSAAAVAPLTDRYQPLPPSTKSEKTFSDFAATVYGSDDQRQRPGDIHN